MNAFNISVTITLVFPYILSLHAPSDASFSLYFL